MAINAKSIRFAIVHEFFRPEQRCALAVIAILVFARHWHDIFLNELRGEDGTDLIVMALWGSFNVFQPIASSMMFLQRCIASLSARISFDDAPLVMSLFSTSIFIYSTAYFSRSTFSWLIPNFYVRLIICGLVALGPGSAELVTNLTCTHYTLGWLLALTLLESPVLHASSFSILWIIISLSSHVSAIFLPLAILKNRLKDTQTRVASFCCIFNLSLHFILGRWSPYKISTVTFRPLAELLPIWIDNLSTFFFYIPLTNYNWFTISATIWPEGIKLIGLVSVAAFGTLLYLRYRTDAHALDAMTGLFLSIVFLIVAHSLARSQYSSSCLQVIHIYDGRYAWIPYISGLLFICCLAGRFAAPRRYPIYLSVIFLLKLADITSHSKSQILYPPANTWKEFISALKTEQDHFILQIAPAALDGTPWAKVYLRRESSGLVVEEITGGNR